MFSVQTEILASCCLCLHTCLSGVCVWVCVPYWASLPVFFPPCPWGLILKTSNKTHLPIWSSSRGSSIKLCCSRATPDEAITPSLLVCVTVSLLLTYLKHMICVSESMRGSLCCVCVWCEWYVAHHSDEIIITSDTTSHGSQPNMGQWMHTTHIPSKSHLFPLYVHVD